MSEFLLQSTRVVIEDRVRPATIFVREGVIRSVESYGLSIAGVPVVDAGDRAVLPGLVDVHTHCNEPGRTEWEGFAHATRAAAAGGYTTIVDMPLNSLPETSTPANLEVKVRAAEGQCWVDYALWGGVVDYNRADIPGLAAAGVPGFKCFLTYPGIEGFTMVSPELLAASMPAVAATGLPLLAHAELDEPIDAARALLDADPTTDWHRYLTYLASRPPEAEVMAIRLLIRLARESGARVHIVHLSAAEALPDLRAARAEGLPITVETCPHYLCFTAEEIPDGATEFKCAPPIRDGRNREELWTALLGGDIDLIATDHSPCPPAMKLRGDGSFLEAWGGISSLQCSLSAVWKEAAQRGIPLSKVMDWMAKAPARLAGLAGRKGSIAAGCDADFVVFDDEATWTLRSEELFSRHPITPYAGRTLRGRVEATYVRGVPVYRQGRHPEIATGRRV